VRSVRPAETDAEAGMAMVLWRCTLEVDDRPTSWRGFDLIHFGRNGKIVHKLTCAKARVPQFDEGEDGR